MNKPDTFYSKVMEERKKRKKKLERVLCTISFLSSQYNNVCVKRMMPPKGERM